MTREDAIKHLENMKWLLGVNNTTVDDIPLTKVIDDIAALLKAQEPRLISLRDAESMRLCWIETKYPHTIRPSDLMHYFDESPCVTVFSIHQTPMDWPIDEYGVKWRCWNKEPTNEQMEVTPWE